MAASNDDNPDGGRQQRLAEALRTIKIAAADRTDVVVDMKEADRARLELLAQELQPVFDDVPADDERFDFAISSGLQPRLWIDATSHVMMGRDRRTYRFVRDTRIGRVVIAENTNMDPVARAVTLYIAERLYEREREMNGDLKSLRTGVQRQDSLLKTESVHHQPEPQPIERPVPARPPVHVAEEETTHAPARQANMGRRLPAGIGGSRFITREDDRESPADPTTETSLLSLLLILAGLGLVGGGFAWLFSVLVP